MESRNELVSTRRKCDLGFTPNLFETDCIDINECLLERNPCEQNCFNTVGSYFCTCSDGYKLSLDKNDCEDIDMCEFYGSDHFCPDEGAFCVDRPGDSVDCDCSPGYLKNVVMNLDNQPQTECVDGNECLDSNSCHESANCINYKGDFACECTDQNQIMLKDTGECILSENFDGSCGENTILENGKCTCPNTGVWRLGKDNSCEKLQNLWAEWSYFSSCSDGCGLAFRVRSRDCLQAKTDNVSCELNENYKPVDYDYELCDQEQCAVTESLLEDSVQFSFTIDSSSMVSWLREFRSKFYFLIEKEISGDNMLTVPESMIRAHPVRGFPVYRENSDTGTGNLTTKFVVKYIDSMDYEWKHLPAPDVLKFMNEKLVNITTVLMKISDEFEIFDGRVSPGLPIPPVTIFENWRWQFTIYWTIVSYSLVGLFALYLMYDSFTSPPGDHYEVSDEDYDVTLSDSNDCYEEDGIDEDTFDDDEWRVKVDY